MSTKQISRIGFILFLFLGVLSLFFYQSNEYIIFTSVGFISFAIFLIPLAIKSNISFFSAWTFFGLSILLGSTIRGIYIGLNYPEHSVLNHYFFLEQDGSNFVFGAVLFVLALITITTSYIYSPVKSSKAYLLTKNYQIDRKRLYIFALVSLVISLVCILLYIQLTGGFNVAKLSSKRSTIDSVQLSASHRTWQSLKMIATISMLAHLFVLVDALRSKRKKIRKYLLAILLFLVATFLPFYTSIRSDIFIYLIFSLAAIYHVKKKLPTGKVIVFALLGILIFQTMSSLRSSKDETVLDTISKLTLDTSLIDSLVLNRNGLELAKTAHIINSIPETLDYKYGSTIAVWLIAPIPREIWNSKPLISPGPIIGTKIYGNRISGVPPGFIGEMYWNFGILGIFLGSFFLGWLLKWVDIRFKPSPQTIPVYIYGPIQIGHLIIGVSLGYGIMNITIKTVIALFVLKLISNKNKKV